MGRKLGGCALPLLGGAGFPSNNVACAEAYQSTTVPSFMLIHPTVWPQYINVTDRQTGQTQRSVAWAEFYLRTKWYLNLSSRLVTTDMGLFLGGGCAPFFGGELGPHLTQCGLGRVYRHAMFHFDPCNRLATIHQRCRQTDRTDRTGQRSDSIGRTVFGRPFVKRFALCYQTVVCLSVCPVCL